MEPTDNFSQKKKKDLVAIATLFGILSEEKANRMTKPALIEYLQEQDRQSKAAAAHSSNQEKITEDEAFRRAADLLIEKLKDNRIEEVIVEEKAVKETPKVPSVKHSDPKAVVKSDVKTAVKTEVKAASPVNTVTPAKRTVTPVQQDKAAPVKREVAVPVEKMVEIPASPIEAPPIKKSSADAPVKRAAPAAKKEAIPSSKRTAAKTPEKPTEKAPVKTPAMKPVKTPAITPVMAPVMTPEIKSAKTPAKESKRAAKILPEIVPESVSKILPEIVPEIKPEIIPAAISKVVENKMPEISTENRKVISEMPAASVSGDMLDSAPKKRRGRPKKSAEETAVQAAEPVLSEVSSPAGSSSESSAESSDDSVAAPADVPLTVRLEREVETVSPNLSAQEEITLYEERSSIEKFSSAKYEAPGSEEYQEQEYREDEYPSPEVTPEKKHVPSEEPQVAKRADVSQEPVHHIGRTKRHSVIIKPKDEEFSKMDSEAGNDESSDDSRDDSYEKSNEKGNSARRQQSSDSFGSRDFPAATAGEHAESPHHARTLRAKEQPQEMISGVLELMSEGYGFLRRENYLQGQNDIYVPAQYVRRFGLRLGDYVVGPCRPKRDSDRYQALQYIKEVNGMPPEKMMRRAHFDRLTPVYPSEKYILETDKTELSTRIIDLVAPIGKGQRGMIVSPPKAGKTVLLQKIANAISINNPDSKLIVLLIDERPEEVTDMQRSINGEVVYSTFDKTPENHVRIVELVLERAMRLVELGQDVIILLDSMTRLARAYNLTINPTGRTLSGGLDPGALYGPKRFFGAARNIEGGGSLTIVATSLIDTGSRMDEVIFEEFKGTGNMEVYLDRRLSEKRIFPAIDINKSGTRHEELLMSPVELDAVWTIRKAFGQLDTAAVTEMIISLLLKTSTNNQFVQSINVSFNDKATFDAMRGTRPAGTSTNSTSAGNGK